MKNNTIEKIPKSLVKEEKLEQKFYTTHLINQNEENQNQNNQDLKKEEILFSKNSFFPLKNNDSKKDIETNDEFNFDFFKDNDDLFNSTVDSHSINITNNEFNQDFDRKKIKLSNSFLMNNKNSCLQLNNDKSDLINDNFCSFNNKTFILPFHIKIMILRIKMDLIKILIMKLIFKISIIFRFQFILIILISSSMREITILLIINLKIRVII